jgi:hypothetical protein
MGRQGERPEAVDPMSETDIRPFRWNVAKREQLGRLLDGPQTETYPDFELDLRTVSAKIIARGGDSRLVFLGRSPENVFDYLSGIFHDAPSPRPFTLLQFSDPPDEVATLARQRGKELAALLGYFSAEGLDPASIAATGAQVRFVDLVSGGNTFTTIFHLLRHWSTTQKADWNAVRRLVGFVGITLHTKNSPNTWRWHQHKDWTGEIERSNIKNISVPRSLWSWIGNHDDKATPSFRIYRWASEDAKLPARDEAHLRGLRLATRLFDHGRDREERKRFAAEVAAQPEMNEAWLRGRVLRLRAIK